jgi:hypothetical protein
MARVGARTRGEQLSNEAAMHCAQARQPRLGKGGSAIICARVVVGRADWMRQHANTVIADCMYQNRCT